MKIIYKPQKLKSHSKQAWVRNEYTMKVNDRIEKKQ
jgi:hypothetical protein